MMSLVVWLATITVGVTLCYGLGSVADAWSSVAAAAIVGISFLITRRFKVAAASTVSKMHTAWFTLELRRLAWRMVLTLVMAGVVFKLTWPGWGVAFWLSVAAYYQMALFLHLRDIRQGSPFSP